ncbi:transporter substrate-binding domain-containing protein [Anaeromyxobacter terrae]|uniref:transporter substrate-binding domain-containing protein n=1 Tax=Anaeromyxobacter terrae TaxID=2925406 RepID=UPI001F5ACDA7|nr:transporter substrate-binding domain-containing protein [Anaeromyxobacter sp. SG22]
MSAVRTLPLLVTAVVAFAGVARAAPAQTLKVGTEGVYAPFTFQDADGKLTGYDVEVVREIARRAGLEPVFAPTPWDSIFLGLESRKFDLVANQIGKTPEREKKYLFTDDYLVSGAQIIVKDGRAGTFSGLESLAGLKVGTGVGSNYSKLLEAYNASHTPGIDIKYYDGTLTTVLQDIVAGRLDATVNDRLTVGYNVKKLALPVKLVGAPLALVPSHFVVRKGPEGEALVKRLNEAIAAAKRDGTLAKLSVKWFGADYTR